MATNAINRVFQQLRQTALRQDGAGLTDGELLESYITRRDEGAFEALLSRHGPMVLGVCRRILRNGADADDAFQATFLVLVRRAASIRPREMVSNWLYGVARITALKAKAMNYKRRAKENEAGTLPKPSTAENDWEKEQSLLDEELGRLPDKYRVPIVLCDLQGKTIKEAARHLNWPQGTVATRLTRGRRLLALRLSKHGLTLSVSALALLISSMAVSASVPASLMAATTKAASLFAAGQAAARVVSAKAAALTEGVLGTMLLSKLKLGTIAVVVTVLLGIGLTRGAQKEPRAPVADRKPIASADKPDTTLRGKLYMHRGLELMVYDPQRKRFADLSQLDKEHQHNYQSLSARLSPDGRFLAFGQAEMGTPPSKIQIREIAKDDPPEVIVSMPHKELSSWSWSPDGKHLSFAVWGEDGKTYQPYVVEVASKKVRKVTLPALKGKGPEGFGALIHAWSPDGLWLVFARGHFYLMHPETREARQLNTEPIGFFSGTCRFSPDGKKMLFIGCPKEKEYNLSVIDLLLGKMSVLTSFKNKWDFSTCWSPDSRRIALSTVEADDDLKPTGPCRVELHEADGKDKPQLLIEERDAILTVTDWR